MHLNFKSKFKQMGFKQWGIQPVLTVSIESPPEIL